MRRWTILSLGAAVFLGGIVAFVIRVNWTVLQPVNVMPEQRFLPGEPRPNDSFCDAHLAWGDVESCNAYPATTVALSFSYDRQKDIITRTSTLGQGLTIGDLILQWGVPSGYRSAGWAVQVYWGKRSVYLVSSTFDPQSRVVFISYDYSPEANDPWKGFISIRHASQ